MPIVKDCTSTQWYKSRIHQSLSRDRCYHAHIFFSQNERKKINSKYCLFYGHIALLVITGIIVRISIFKSIHCNISEVRVPVDLIDGYSLFKCVTMTWHGWGGIKMIVLAMATRWHMEAATPQRVHNVIMTSLRQNDITTSFWRNNDFAITSSVRWVVRPNQQGT